MDILIGVSYTFTMKNGEVYKGVVNSIRRDEKGIPTAYRVSAAVNTWLKYTVPVEDIKDVR